MRGVSRRPQQANRDRLDPALGDPAQCVAHLRLVERHHYVALGVDSLTNLEGQSPRHVRLDWRIRQVERIELAALAQHQDVRKALGDQERGARGVALDDRVGRVGGAVDQEVGVAQHVGDADAGLLGRHLERPFNTAENALVSRERFAEHEAAALVGQHEVGKGSARIDRYPIGHLRRSSYPSNLRTCRASSVRAEAARPNQISPLRLISSLGSK